MYDLENIPMTASDVRGQGNIHVPKYRGSLAITEVTNKICNLGGA